VASQALKAIPKKDNLDQILKKKMKIEKQKQDQNMTRQMKLEEK